MQFYYYTTIQRFTRLTLTITTVLWSTFSIYAQSSPFAKKNQAPSIAFPRQEIQNSNTQEKKAEEDFAKRSKYGKHFNNSDGTKTVQIGGNYHYLDAAGLWQDYDLNILENKGFLQNTTNDIATNFPSQSNNGIVMQFTSGQEFTWWTNPQLKLPNYPSLKGNLATHEINSNRLTYKNVYPGISEQIEIIKGGLESSTIIEEKPSYIDELSPNEFVTFSHFIPLKKNWIIKDIEGNHINQNLRIQQFSIQLDGEDQTIYFGKITVFDHSLTKKEALQLFPNLPADKITKEQENLFKNNVLNLPYQLVFTNGGIEVLTEIPVSWLQNPSRSYPVTIDPTVTITYVDNYQTLFCALSNLYGYQRHSSLYLQSEIGTFGLITSLEFHRAMNTQVHTYLAKIYLRNTPNITLQAGNWEDNNHTGTATLCFNQTVTEYNTDEWIMFPFENPYLYNGGNLNILVQDDYGNTGQSRYLFSGEQGTANRRTQHRVDMIMPPANAVMELDYITHLNEIRFTYIPLGDCDQLPSTIDLHSNAMMVCPEEPFQLSLADMTSTNGLTTQWQKSIDGISWSNLGTSQSPTSYLIQTGQTTETYYRAVLDCSISTETLTSEIITITMAPPTLCYCSNEVPFNCSDGDEIQNVTFAGINNNSGCSTSYGYSDYTVSVPSAQVVPGSTVPFSVRVGPSGGGWIYESVGAWIDFNRNGILDSLEGEYFVIGTGLNEVLTSNLTIPATAQLGSTRLRVVLTATRHPQNVYMCGPLTNSENFGEMEDYTVEIVSAIQPIYDITVSTLGNIPPEINTNEGTLQLTSQILPAIHSQMVIWSLNPPQGIGTLNTDGLFTASDNGTVWAKATSVQDPNFSDSILLTISNQILRIDSIVIKPVNNLAPSINVDQGTLQLQATIYPLEHNQDVFWLMVNTTGSASVSNSGMVTAHANGSVWARAQSVTHLNVMDSIEIILSNQTLDINAIPLQSFQIFPNPTTDLVHIHHPNAQEGMELQIMDMLGKIVLRQHYSIAEFEEGAQLSLNNFAKGMYLLRIKGLSNSYQTKILKQ